MVIDPMHRLRLLAGLLVLSNLIAGCSMRAGAQGQVTDPQALANGTATYSPTPFQAVTNTAIVIPPSYTPTATFTPTATNTPLPTDTPTPTETPLPTDTPEPVYIPGGQLSAPILLYHHISEDGIGNRYFVTPEVFRAQLQALRDWGYTSVTVSQLVDVLINGGVLPPRPVAITFDDGNVDIYENAFPIMQEMGFVGTFYIVGNRLESKYFVTADQLIEMVNAGWEIGDHGMSHIDLTADHSTIGYEVATSRSFLEDTLGVTINTIAYPYGVTDEFVTNKVAEYGYQAAMGLGLSWKHSWGTLFYMTRIEVRSDYDMSKFASLLPWSG